MIGTLLVFGMYGLSAAVGTLSIYCFFFHRTGRKVVMDRGKEYVISQGSIEWFVGTMSGLFCPVFLFIAIVAGRLL